MTLEELAEIIEAKKKTGDATSSYTAKLLATGVYRIAQKVGEEGVETALAGVKGDKREIISETADLLYHTLVLLAHHEINLQEVFAELETRHKQKNHDQNQ